MTEAAVHHAAVHQAAVHQAAVHQVMSDAVIEVLEKMFFVEANHAPAAELVREPGIAVELEFDGEHPGVFRMSLARAAASLIAADFLGEDAAALKPQQVEDVAGELANMICGAVLSRLESSATFHLSAPVVVQSERAGVSSTAGTACAVDTGNGLLIAEIQMRNKACSTTVKLGS